MLRHYDRDQPKLSYEWLLSLVGGETGALNSPSNTHTQSFVNNVWAERPRSNRRMRSVGTSKYLVRRYKTSMEGSVWYLLLARCRLQRGID